MRFLIDECLSIDLVSIASQAGHEAQHVAHVGTGIRFPASVYAPERAGGRHLFGWGGRGHAKPAADGCLADIGGLPAPAPMNPIFLLQCPPPETGADLDFMAAS
jgi:hypothetical protein